MTRRRGLLAGTLALAAMAGRPAIAQAPAAAPGAEAKPAAPMGDLKPLGNDRFQIGRIIVDKRAGRFSVPGRVHALDKPLEYLATAPGGMKAYEALFEVDAIGTEFNLACILIGLEADPQQVPWQQFRDTPRLRGRPLSISVAWTDGSKRREASAAEALLNADAGVAPGSVQWVYVGAPASEFHRRFVPDDTGTLIGFIHDANCIIESVATIGVGAYGSVRGNDKLLPPNGSAIELIVAAPAR
jgi:hypothetical protein